MAEITDLEQRLDKLFRYAQVGYCVNGVTHDINNLLGAIMAYSEIVLLDESLGEESKRMLGEILDAVTRCSGLITSITDIARPEKDVLSITEAHKVVDRVLLIRSYAMRTNQTAFEHHHEEIIPSVNADAPKIQLALLYLIFNAEENAVSGETRRVSVETKRAGDGVEITVFDSGPVVPEALRDTIFEKGFTTKESPHTGNGLYMARQIAEAHQGSLIYDPDRGFIFTLPMDANTG